MACFEPYHRHDHSFSKPNASKLSWTPPTSTVCPPGTHQPPTKVHLTYYTQTAYLQSHPSNLKHLRPTYTPNSWDGWKRMDRKGREREGWMSWTYMRERVQGWGEDSNLTNCSPFRELPTLKCEYRLQRWYPNNH
jgi:hypothetical protein